MTEQDLLEQFLQHPGHKIFIKKMQGQINDMASVKLLKWDEPLTYPLKCAYKEGQIEAYEDIISFIEEHNKPEEV